MALIKKTVFCTDGVQIEAQSVEGQYGVDDIAMYVGTYLGGKTPDAEQFSYMSRDTAIALAHALLAMTSQD